MTKHFTRERLFSKSSLLAWLLLVALLPLLIATIFTYQAAKKALLEQMEERLSHIVQEKVYQVEKYIEERKADINELALNPDVAHLANLYKITGDPAVIASEAKRELGYYLAISFQGYRELFLISPDGKIWYSANTPALSGKNIQQLPKNYKQLIKVFDEANTLMSVQISDIEMDEKKWTSWFYLATPIFENGHIVAILALTLPGYQIQKVLTTTSTLGQSGETLIAQPGGIERVIISRQNISVINMNRSGSSEIEKVLKDAGQGVSGFGELTDQNGVDVIAAWRFLPSLGWGILVKMSLAEAFAPIMQLRNQLYLLSALTLGLVILLARMVANNIRRAEERTEQVLLNILPQTILERLKQGESAIADNFEASVLFADIVGFTHFSNDMSAEKVVELLNNIFSRFDTIIEAVHAEKIKTIGDAYMVASGLPDANPDHARQMADVALMMKIKLAEWNSENNTNYQMRIGIASGPVTAGIVGFKKFTYDVWGKTVNLASRMESQGVPDQIQVAESTRLILKDQYDFEKRGEIDVKGMGKMTTYFLLGKKNAS